MPIVRDGRGLVEQRALARLIDDIAAMAASDVVQLLLWPQTVADWARANGVATPVAYNMLARFKPYRRVREQLAARLEVPAAVVDHLIDAPRPQPAARRAAPADVVAAPAVEDDPFAPVSPTVRLAPVRDGGNPLERRAVARARREIAALPASLVVQIAMFPETLAEWSRRRGLHAPLIYAALAGTHRHPSVRDALARRLDVAPSALDHLIDGVRAEPVAFRPPVARSDLALDGASVSPAGAVDDPDDESGAAPGVESNATAPPPQLDLGL